MWIDGVVRGSVSSMSLYGVKSCSEVVWRLDDAILISDPVEFELKCY